MDTINGYMVVAQGGSYSDKYHYNERFYLDRSEAVAYIESKKEATREWNQFVALCPKSPIVTTWLKIKLYLSSLILSRRSSLFTF